MTDRIKKLLDATQPFCPGLNKHLSIKNDSGKLFGEFYLKDSTKRADLEAVLNAFDDILVGSCIYEPLQHDVVREDIALSYYEDLEKITIADLRYIVKKAQDQLGNDMAYCLSIWLDPAQGGWNYLIGCEKAFQATLEKRQSGPDAKLYATKQQIQHFRFYEYSTFDYYPSQEIQELIDNSSERSYNHYVKYGNEYLRQKGSHHLEFMTDAVSRALKICHTDITQNLRATDDFVMYVRYYDQDELTHYRAARRTISAESIRLVMSELYGDLVKVHTF